ncbi:ArsA family ATPase [Candidatus Woesearchaeota archaeon]|nr:ArsA family ATPase [Candidatus Woesearchaeota archaeon]
MAILKWDEKKQLILFGGKGGVGKTSISCATALWAAKHGKRVLIFSTDPVHSLSDCFGKKIGDTITPIAKNLSALEINAEKILEEYKAEHGTLIEQIIGEGTYLDDGDIKKLSQLSMPGLDEVMALKKIMEFIGDNSYDQYILDTAPSGHTIRLLALPDLIDKWVDVLVLMHKKKEYMRQRFTGRNIEDEASRFLKRLKEDIRKVRDILCDVDRTLFQVITIPEAMAVEETTRFCSLLEEYNIPVQNIIINQMIPKNVCSFCSEKREQQQEQISNLKKKKEHSLVRLVEIPLYLKEIQSLETIEIFSQIIYDEENIKNVCHFSSAHKSLSRKKFAKAHALSSMNIHAKINVNKETKLLLFGGKGGVGKTTLACATALHYAKKGKRVFVFSTDPAHSLSDSFGVRIEDEVTQVAPNLYALEMNAAKLFEELRNEYKKEIEDFFKHVFLNSRQGGMSLPIDQKIMTNIFDLSPPGIDELMALKKFIDLLEEKKYDLFILDTAPSAHTLRLLALPDNIIDWTTLIIELKRKYPMSGNVGTFLQKVLQTIKKAKEIFHDTEKTQFVAVTIPEAMGFYQTKDLVERLQQLKIPVKNIIVNKMTPENSCDFCISRRKQEDPYAKAMREEFPLCTVLFVPYETREVRTIGGLEAFSGHIYNIFEEKHNG